MQSLGVRERVCVCVCVCVRARMCEYKTETDGVPVLAGEENQSH